MTGNDMKNTPNEVDRYLAKAPKDVQNKLKA